MTKLESSGTIREFIVVKPSSVAPSEKLPVVFVWHWLGGSADDAFEKLFLQEAAELHRLVMVVPKAKGDLLFRWPFLFSDSQGRIDEELKFFEDMLACVAAAYPQAVRQCVASVGVSAGALFSDQLAGSRANRIASFVSLSGGVGTTARPWPKPSRRLPGVVLWGGPTDDYQGLYDFHKGSLALEDALVGQGNFFVECVHNCGHDVPPFDAPPGGTRFDAVWRFILDHPFWVAPGTSPYLGTPLPEPFPDWCGQGKGGAVPRAEGSPC
jgi:predicted esterase